MFNEDFRSKIDSDFFDRLKNKNLTKREEILTGALILLATGVIGYYGFIKDPLQNNRTYAQAIENARTRTVSAEEDSASPSTEKPLFKESDVVEAVNEYIQMDPFIAIVDQDYPTNNGLKAVLELSLEHNGSSGELSQFIEQINDAPYLITTDYLTYNQDLDGQTNSNLTVRIPYIIEDNSLEGTVFANQSPIMTTPVTNSTPPTTATPKNSNSTKAKESNTGSKTQNSNTSTWNKSTPSTSVKPKSSTSSTTSVNSSKKPSHQSNSNTTKPAQVQDKKQEQSKKNKEPVKQFKAQSEKPNKQADTIYYAEPIMSYSILDTLLDITASDGVVLDIEKSVMDKKENDLLYIKLSSLNPQKQDNSEGYSNSSTAADQANSQEINIADNSLTTANATQGDNAQPTQQAVERAIRMNTGGIYLPKNAYEMSFDIQLPLQTQGKFTFILADEAGNIKEVKEDRRHDLKNGYHRIFFKLNDMDGTIRATQLRYKFTDKGYFEDELVMRNYQILSEK